jgi:glycogen operon protein
VRDFWRGAERGLGELAYRLTGSSDLYASSGRSPHASINFVTCHDGFTLRDLVSYHEKRNEANGEGNRDGEAHNRTWNCGVEGETDDPDVVRLRKRQQRNFLATLFLSQGVPMLSMGDEVGRTQRGNNNAYCQDGPISYVDWSSPDEKLRDFTAGLVDLRRKHPVFARRRWFQGRSIRGSNLTDIGWFKPDGDQMSDDDWNVAFARALGVFLNGEGIAGTGPRGERILDSSFYLLLNAGNDDVAFRLPATLGTTKWRRVLQTDEGFVADREPTIDAGSVIDAMGHSLILLIDAG